METGNGVKLYSTIRKNGKLYLRGYVLYSNHREDFLMVEQDTETAFARLRRLRDEIDAAHPRKGIA